MPSNGKKFGLDLSLIEFMDDGELAAIPIFENREMCVGKDDIIPTLEIYLKRLKQFVETKLKGFDC